MATLINKQHKLTLGHCAVVDINTNVPQQLLVSFLCVTTHVNGPD